jgi:hypothetical protein
MQRIRLGTHQETVRTTVETVHEGREYVIEEGFPLSQFTGVKENHECCAPWYDKGYSYKILNLVKFISACDLKQNITHQGLLASLFLAALAIIWRF